jgi:hypothetical protein
VPIELDEDVEFIDMSPEIKHQLAKRFSEFGSNYEEITVGNYDWKGVVPDKYWAYNITTVMRNHNDKLTKYEVWRRFTEFEMLHQYVQRNYKGII